MSEGRSSAGILFVDDEPSIRLTLPPIPHMFPLPTSRKEREKWGTRRMKS